MKKKKKKAKTYRKKRHRSISIDYDYHLPVLLEQAVDYLITDNSGLYIDGTLGGGGHAAEIIRRLDSGGKIIAFDKDEEAIKHCQLKFGEELIGSGRITLINDSFSKACSIEEIKGKVHGFLLDLGVSSRQLDNSRRGFSYRTDSRLDMRFADSEKTAEEILNQTSEKELTEIFRIYGEEPLSSVIARRIIQRRRASSLSTTGELRALVEELVPHHLLYKTLSRVFQALRIAVNNELQELDTTLRSAFDILAPGGRMVVISYHSLEDRIVKSIFRETSKVMKNYQKTDTEYPATTVPIARLLNTKPIIPSPEELLDNPRARSAKMRVVERV